MNGEHLAPAPKTDTHYRVTETPATRRQQVQVLRATRVHTSIFAEPPLKLSLGSPP